ncbi:MAG: cytochrome c-type biogenesis protein CcmH [Longimicrobiales bacterium]|nr:cytochrome c-type biogenesis protein CcmH [Longimicrobiales bacterium]
MTSEILRRRARSEGGAPSDRGWAPPPPLFVAWALVLLASTFLLSTPAHLHAQEPESVQEMGESPALQQIPEEGEDQADGPVPIHPEAEEAIGRLRSPWCPGFMLEVCPSPQANAFRDTLRMLAHQGVEADSLVEWALARQGEEWRALPRAEGTGLLAWVIPPVVLILGAGLVVVVLRRLRKGAEGYRTGEDLPELSEDEERRIQEALRDLEWEGR